jgi:hypothetical protein
MNLSMQGSTVSAMKKALNGIVAESGGWRGKGNQRCQEVARRAEHDR